MVESIGKAYKPWIVVSLVVLVGSLLLLAVVGTVGFIYFASTGMPIWLILLGVVSALGVAFGLRRSLPADDGCGLAFVSRRPQSADHSAWSRLGESVIRPGGSQIEG